MWCFSYHCQNAQEHPLACDPFIKGTNFLNNILDSCEDRIKQGYSHEGVILNLEGLIAEGTISNIFHVKSGIALYTTLENE